ncbi:MDR family MFS transporter [Peribacillus deserti]|uniref:MFS transporter n=1 Tax=Peribacillus deserti TaxID=673318 RepID=A0A2N5M8Q0_9BACI|nr:MFS transporter [Peribacillus deserti]PLT30741.1 MFS transporter [Peribacillus deserti]
MTFFKLHRNIQIRILTSFLTRIVGSMIFPFMAIYFAQELGSSLAGILLLINVAASIISGFYGGYITDKIGRKKVLVMGQALTTISFVFMTFSNSPWFESVWLTFFMMLINSLSSGFVNPAAEAMLIDVSTKETRSFMYSINYWAINASIMIGSLMGGFLFKTHKFELFISLTGVSVLTLLLIVFLMTDGYKPVKTAEKLNVWKDMALSYRTVMHNRAFLIFSLASIFILGLEMQRNNYISIRLEEGFTPVSLAWLGTDVFHIDGIRMFSFLTTENTLIIVLFTVFIAGWIRKYREKDVLYIGIITQVIGYSVLAASNSIWILLAAGLVQTIGEMMYVPVRQTMMADLMEEDARGAYMALNGLVFQGAKLIGAAGIILGAAIGSWGMAAVYILCGIVAMGLFTITIKGRGTEAAKNTGKTSSAT